MNPRLQTSLAVQWLRHLASTAGGTGLILGRGIKILHSEWHSQKVERKKIPKSVFKEERGKGDGEELEMQENSKDSIRL